MFKKILVCFAFVLCSTLWGGDIATKAELEAFEKLALTDANRALELSMYYQGWSKDECFYVFDNPKSDSPITRDYVKDSELSRQLKMRDFDKALHFAEIAFNLDIDDLECQLNLLKLYLLDYKNYKTKIDKFIENKYFTKNLYAYISFLKGDLDEAKKLLNYSHYISWKHFYTGKFAPKNLDFVEFFLNNYEVIKDNAPDEAWDNVRLDGAYYLYLIYAGKLNPDDKDLVKAEKYSKLFESKKSEILQYYINYWAKANALTFEEFSKDKSSSKLNLFIYKKMSLYLSKYEYRGFVYDTNFFIENPFYSPEKAKEYQSKIKSTYEQSSMHLMLLIMGHSLDEARKYRAELDKCDYLSPEEKSKLFDRADPFLARKSQLFSQPYKIIKE
ncbi:MAG: hypothetical protein R3Y46_03700 [Opitutales bacterium]